VIWQKNSTKPFLKAVCLVVSGLLFWGGVFIPSRGESSCDPSPSREESLLSTLSLEQKIGQMLFFSFRGGPASPELEDLLERYAPGGLILYSSRGNVDSLEQTVALITGAQEDARRYGMLPPFFSIDQEGGLIDRIRQGVTVFPGNMALGAAGDPELAKEQARVTASELRALGITWNFAPVVDVNSNPANPVINIRSFGENPREVASLGVAMVRPYESEGVLCTPKHYPGHGDTHVDSHVGLPRVDRPLEVLEEVDLLPFRETIRAGVPAVMTAHVLVPALAPENPELPATLSREVLQGLRRQGFEGIIVTDSMGMGAIRQGWGAKEAALLTVEAGADVLLYGADPDSGPLVFEEVFSGLLEGVRSGRISERRIDESVLRILTAKIRTRILDDPFPREHWRDLLQKEESLEVSRRIAQESVTLVRNEGNLLPLSENARIPLLVPEERREEVLPLLEEVPQFFPLYVRSSLEEEPVPLSSEEVREIENAPCLGVASWGLTRYPGLGTLAKDFSEKPLLYLALRSPYDLLQIPRAAAYLCTYGDTPASLEALGWILTGKAFPKGKLPVELPGFYPRGWGMQDF